MAIGKDCDNCYNNPVNYGQRDSCLWFDQLPEDEIFPCEHWGELPEDWEAPKFCC
jgi:hypothetical protein